MATVEQVVKVRMKVMDAKMDYSGNYELTIPLTEARRVASELLDATTAPLLDKEPKFHGIQLTDDQWDKLEENVRKAKAEKTQIADTARSLYGTLTAAYFPVWPDIEAAKRKKKTKKPKKAKPKQEPVVAPKRKK